MLLLIRGYFVIELQVSILPESEFGTVVVAGACIEINQHLGLQYGIQKGCSGKMAQGIDGINLKMLESVNLFGFNLNKKVLCSFVPAL